MRSSVVFLAFIAIVVRAAGENTTTAAITTAAATTDASTTGATTVAPSPTSATWTVKDKEDKERLPCLILSVAMLNASIKYKDTKGAALTAMIPINSSFYVDEKNSSCGKTSKDAIHNEDDDAVLTLTNGFTDNRGVTLALRLTDNENITGAKSGTKFQWYHALVEYNTANAKYFPDAASKRLVVQQNNNTLKFFSTPNGSIYECKANLQYVITNSFTLVASGVDAVAYKYNASLASNKKEICAQDDQTNDLVPIIVGAALAALVVVVLIAYLIGRVRAKRAGGYESV